MQYTPAGNKHAARCRDDVTLCMLNEPLKNKRYGRDVNAHITPGK